MLKKINLDYNFDIFLNADYSVHEGSCISHQVHELTDIHEEYGGFPDSYESENTKIRQLWWDNTQVDFDAIGKQLGIEPITISTILQPPGNTIPIHRDTFFQINKRFPNDTRLKVRANIYLEEWKVGHFLQYQEHDKQWHNSTHWNAGDGFIWDSQHLHLSSNAGMKPKYTLQVSGFMS
jgi:hypothetical protein